MKKINNFKYKLWLFQIILIIIPNYFHEKLRLHKFSEKLAENLDSLICQFESPSVKFDINHKRPIKKINEIDKNDRVVSYLNYLAFQYNEQLINQYNKIIGYEEKIENCDIEAEPENQIIE